MSIIRLELPEHESPCTGKSISFLAPCDCTQTECLQINGTNYSVVDSIGRLVTGKSGVWAKDALVTVILNCETQQAYIQNCAIPELAIANIEGLEQALGDKSDSGHGHSIATQSAKGMMSAADKKKLDNIEAGANKIVVDSEYNKDSGNPVSTAALQAWLTTTYMNKSAGGTMKAPIKTSGLILKEGTDYGDTLPDDLEKGKLFFLKIS